MPIEHLPRTTIQPQINMRYVPGVVNSKTLVTNCWISTLLLHEAHDILKLVSFVIIQMEIASNFATEIETEIAYFM